MERLFERDLSGVRVHTDAQASASARELGASAYTVGRHVVFAQGRFAPRTDRGHKLLVHELAHVVQQGGREPVETTRLQLLPLDSPAERAVVATRPDRIPVGQHELSIARQVAHEPVAGPAAQGAQLPVEDWTDRLVRAIGVWETNRRGLWSRPRESRLRTVAGVPASMATVEQATMPYAVTALQQHPALRARVQPALTPAELRHAQARIRATDRLLRGVAAAGGTAPSAFIRAHSRDIAASGLGADRVRTMFAAEGLHRTVLAAHRRVVAHQTTARAEAAAIPAGQRLGLDRVSLQTYIADPVTWGENRAAWERLAVRQMPGDVAARIERVATDNGGTAIASAVVRSRIERELTRRPRATLREVVTDVAQLNNPHEVNYGVNVWRVHQRLFPDAH